MIRLDQKSDSEGALLTGYLFLAPEPNFNTNSPSAVGRDYPDPSLFVYAQKVLERKVI